MIIYVMIYFYFYQALLIKFAMKYKLSFNILLSFHINLFPWAKLAGLHILSCLFIKILFYAKTRQSTHNHKEQTISHLKTPFEHCSLFLNIKPIKKYKSIYFNNMAFFVANHPEFNCILIAKFETTPHKNKTIHMNTIHFP